ncbi:hypothetical protein BCR34DRAFT_637727, partial [Clohesyomyces aquaticus]
SGSLGSFQCQWHGLRRHWWWKWPWRHLGQWQSNSYLLRYILETISRDRCFLDLLPHPLRQRCDREQRHERPYNQPRPKRSLDHSLRDIIFAPITRLFHQPSNFSTNLIGAFNTFLSFLPLLEQGNIHPESRGKTDFIQSQFITITSMAGLARNENVSHMYAASKAGLIHLTKMLATGFANRGIRTNSICPGLYITEMTEVRGQADDCFPIDTPGSLPIEQHPMTRTGSAKDIAGAIIFLTSQAGAYVNGNILLSDGGAFSLQPATY